MQRYDNEGMDILYPNPDGPWVKVEDVVSLNARVAELEAALRQANEETKLYPEHEGRYAHLLR